MNKYSFNTNYLTFHNIIKYTILDIVDHYNLPNLNTIQSFSISRVYIIKSYEYIQLSNPFIPNDFHKRYHLRNTFVFDKFNIV